MIDSLINPINWNFFQKVYSKSTVNLKNDAKYVLDLLMHFVLLFLIMFFPSPWEKIFEAYRWNNSKNNLIYRIILKCIFSNTYNLIIVTGKSKS